VIEAFNNIQVVKEKIKDLMDHVFVSILKGGSLNLLDEEEDPNPYFDFYYLQFE